MAEPVQIGARAHITALLMVVAELRLQRDPKQSLAAHFREAADDLEQLSEKGGQFGG